LESEKKIWDSVRAAAKVDYRWHDLRHTFVTRLAENPSVNEQTIRALAGTSAAGHYSLIRTQEKANAIRALKQSGFEERAQKWGQSTALEKPAIAE
jgi:integrase